MGATDDRRRSDEATRAPAERAPAGIAPEAPVADPLERLASDMGNHAFSTLAREGSGILPDGRAHPEVESAIAAGRGAGSPVDVRGLDAGVRDQFSDVRVHTDGHADQLARSVQARAFTTGSDVWFAAGEYRPGTGEGDRLLAHELAHVVQQRGAPTSGPLKVSQPGDALETQADSAAGDLLG